MYIIHNFIINKQQRVLRPGIDVILITTTPFPHMYIMFLCIHIYVKEECGILLSSLLLHHKNVRPFFFPSTYMRSLSEYAKISAYTFLWSMNDDDISFLDPIHFYKEWSSVLSLSIWCMIHFAIILLCIL